MLRLLSLILLFTSTFVLAYTPTEQEVYSAGRLSRQLNRMVDKVPPDTKKVFVTKVANRIDSVEDSLLSSLDSSNYGRMYLLEYLKRHLPGTTIIDKEDIIYDEEDSTIWNHAPNRFDIIYTPYETPALYKVDEEKKYSVLLNGGYYFHNDNSIYHAGVLGIGGNRYTPFVPDDPQITHFYCQDLEGAMHIYPNAIFSEGMIATCPILFQAGPLFYAREDERVEENFLSRKYIGKKHKRTILILFESTKEDMTSTKGDTDASLSSIQSQPPSIPPSQGGMAQIQDLWFLTINEEVTLAEARNIILRESRFIGEYDNIYALNLDGGSSIAHINREYPELNIGKYKILPTIVAIK